MAKTDSSEPVKYFDDQFDDEEVLLVFKKHPVVMRKGLILAMLGVLLPVLYTGILTELSIHRNWESAPSLTFLFISLLIGLFLGALIMLPYWITWNFSVFIVTDQRFLQISQKGFFSKSIVDVGINQIQMVNYEVSGVQESMLGFGTIMMQTFIGDLVIHDVHHPAKIQKKIIKILREKGALGAQPVASGQEDA